MSFTNLLVSRCGRAQTHTKPRINDANLTKFSSMMTTIRNAREDRTESNIDTPTYEL